MGFLFRDARNETTFLSTAAHVVEPESIVKVDGRTIGRVVAWEFGEEDTSLPVNVDWALVELEPGINFTPEISRIGGPTGIRGDVFDHQEFCNVAEDQAIHNLVNREIRCGEIVHSQEAVLDFREFAFGGESGGPVISKEDGAAYGLAVRTGFGTRDPFIRAYPICHMMERMLVHGFDLQLLPAPYSEPDVEVLPAPTYLFPLYPIC